MLFIFWELVGLCSYLLIGFWYYKPNAASITIGISMIQLDSWACSAALLLGFPRATLKGGSFLAMDSLGNYDIENFSGMWKRNLR